MIAEKMRPLIENNSAIRAMFEEGNAWPPSTDRKMSMISALAIPMCRRRRR